jgi:ABC-type dipeptide/oligopeptide/nickel transport system ATPase subunit
VSAAVLRVEKLKIAGLPPLSFEVGDGECMGIEGPSGSGKTRLARALADLEQANGHILINGAEKNETPPTEWRCLVRYLSAEPGWWTDTPREAFPSDARSASKLQRLLKSLNLSETLLDQPIAVLSTGERQRLAIARALLDEPPVIVLDEPTSALDQKNTALVEELLRHRMLSGNSVLLISHDQAQIERLSDLRLQLAPLEPETVGQKVRQ